jgi:hypothetical protein
MTMRYSEIRARPAAPDSHPFTADITIDPAEFDNFERRIWNRHDVMLLCRIDRPDTWVVHVACTSEAVHRDLLHAWG